MAAQAAVEAREEEEWELCNDDGFVYKRKKRSKHEDSVTAAAASADDEAELRRRRREQKKQFLAKLRDRYQREIAQWESLSNTLQDIEERTEGHQHRHEQRREQPSTLEEEPVPGPELQRTSGSACLMLVDELLLQVEAQEEIIGDISNLCDAAEAMCKAEEERFKQPLFDLPVWSSPRALMAALCDDQDFCNNGDNTHQIT